MKRFQVETYSLGGWANCWTDENGNPITYASQAEAINALNAYLEDVKEAVRCGDLAEEYNRHDYRII
jgi:hypothetical protein